MVQIAGLAIKNPLLANCAGSNLEPRTNTGKFLSKALIFASTNPQYDDRLITSSIHENSKLKPGENMLCTGIVSDIQNNFCTQLVLQRRASDKDLPV